ncbi:hypothetical protein G6F22_021481 [Rhizopus arrhizus]|nr:hypothetical protein G6F22_021481 [Rhizopus arrhizus]
MLPQEIHFARMQARTEVLAKIVHGLRRAQQRRAAAAVGPGPASRDVRGQPGSPRAQLRSEEHTSALQAPR